MIFFFFKQKTAYEMRISDWSSDVCSSDVMQLGEALADPELRDQTAEALPRNQGCDGSFNDECAATLKEDGDMAVAGHGNGQESLARLRRQGDKSGIARSQSRSMARRVTPTFAPMQPLPRTEEHTS